MAPLVRGPHVRALGLTVGRRAQVSCNLIDPGRHGPARLYDDVAALVAEAGGAVEGAELVGLVPEIGARRRAPRAAGPSSGCRRGRRWSPAWPGCTRSA